MPKLTIPFIFAPETPPDPAKMNANWQAVQDHYNGNLGSDNVKSGEVTGAKIITESLLENNIGDQAVTNDKISIASVNSINLADDSFGQTQLAPFSGANQLLALRCPAGNTYNVVFLHGVGVITIPKNTTEMVQSYTWSALLESGDPGFPVAPLIVTARFVPDSFAIQEYNSPTVIHVLKTTTTQIWLFLNRTINMNEWVDVVGKIYVEVWHYDGVLTTEENIIGISAYPE